MSDINFYHIKNMPIENVLMMLLQKPCQQIARLFVRCYNHSLEHYDQALWTIQKEAFLPHATSKDALAEKQPIYLTTENDNPNKAEFLSSHLFQIMISLKSINVFLYYSKIVIRKVSIGQGHYGKK